MQKHVHLVDLVKSFPTNIYLQNLASIQKRTSPVKFAHLTEKSGKGSISNHSTKVEPSRAQRCAGRAVDVACRAAGCAVSAAQPFLRFLFPFRQPLLGRGAPRRASPGQPVAQQILH